MAYLGLTTLIWASEKIEKPRVELLVAAAGPSSNCQGFSPILVLKLLELGCYLIQSFIPGDSLPLVFTFFSHPLKGIVEAAWMVNPLLIRVFIKDFLYSRKT